MVNNINHITGKPDYINKNIKKVSKDHLLFSLKQVNQKNKLHRYEMMVDTANALHAGNFVCLPSKKGKVNQQ